MTDDEKIKLLRDTLQKVLDEEMTDYKAAQEFGGYVLEDPVRQEIYRALDLTD